MTWISPIQLKELFTTNSACLVDVRETYEHQICKISALYIPMAEMKSRYPEIPSDKEVVIMCRSGKRAEAVAHLMETELGFKGVKVLEGGILNWIETIDPSMETY
ncbi:MAG: rhodanese-like domain-containing protein [Bacteroidetes bacterium]|nr:rhodanese-like domain-containing protein [Bacteroidota bacterium]